MAFFSSGSDDEGPAGGAYRVDVDRGDSGLTRIRDVFLSKPASASLVVWVCLRWCHAVRTSGQFLWSLPPLLPHYVVPLAVSSERKGGWGCMRFAVCSSAQVVACKALQVENANVCAANALRAVQLAATTPHCCFPLQLEPSASRIPSSWGRYYHQDGNNVFVPTSWFIVPPRRAHGHGTL